MDNFIALKNTFFNIENQMYVEVQQSKLKNLQMFDHAILTSENYGGIKSNYPTTKQVFSNDTKKKLSKLAASAKRCLIEEKKKPETSLNSMSKFLHDALSFNIADLPEFSSLNMGALQQHSDYLRAKIDQESRNFNSLDCPENFDPQQLIGILYNFLIYCRRNTSESNRYSSIDNLTQYVKEYISRKSVGEYIYTSMLVQDLGLSQDIAVALKNGLIDLEILTPEGTVSARAQEIIGTNGNNSKNSRKTGDYVQ